MTERRHVWISGRVQGVFFRDACARQAAKLSVTGWVRNLPDGRVEAVFEGSPSAVAEMLAWCQAGTPRAHVTGVVVETEEAIGEREFGVR